MSQKASRKSAVNEEKEKNSDTPVKEMKKKMAANAEKEKQAAEKITEKPAEKPEKTDKNAEKTDKATEKTEKQDKNAEKVDKIAEKNEKTDKKADKAEKKQDKQVEKTVDTPAEKNEEKDSNSKDDKSGKPDKPEKKPDAKPKQNGKSSMNGSHGAEENGTVSAVDEFDEDDELVIDDRDEMFPELTYDDESDPEFEPPTPEPSSRSFTRRSQAKATRTPETPRPASDKQAEPADDPSKVLKLKEDVPTTDRKLRSADSPKPQDAKKKQESPKKQDSKDGKQESETNQEEKENGDKTEKVEVDVVIEIDGDEEPRKTDTNYSKSRVKVSPYRRSVRADQTASSVMANYTGENTGLGSMPRGGKTHTNYSKSRVKVSPYRRSVRADQTASSVMANYTGNNTTMEMDITETSSFVSHEDPSLDDSSYLSGLRSIRGRRSYKPLKEMTLRHITANRSAAKSSTTTPASEQPSRPTGTVVGRKRKPDCEDSIELASEASEVLTAAHSKRMRLLDRLTHSFRRTASSTPLPARRAAEIVGINTDLPLTAPVASPETFDPESLKPAVSVSVSPDVCLTTPPAVSPAPTEADRDSKRCVVM
ncbi:hypothetical protein ABMA28_009965 [Loxostege sticticalis]|uniref:Uncharacterized protein n=1 Tax=Loxostege sticticalis TaxID=481309 RepID=A0ABD0SC02_LOXSC